MMNGFAYGAQSLFGYDKNGHKYMTPGESTLLSNIEVTFVRGVRGAQATAIVCVLGNGGRGITLDIRAGEAHLAASLSGLGGALMGVAWIRVSRGQESRLAFMEVIMGEETPPVPRGFKVLALLKASLREENVYWDSSDSEEEAVLEKPFQISVKVEKGLSDTYDDLFPYTTVLELKKKIHSTRLFPPDQQRLVFGGKQLEDGRTLGSYGITAGSDVHFVLRCRGG